MTRARVGSVEVIAVSDGGFDRPPARFFPEVSADALASHRRYFDEHGNVALNLGSFVLRAGGRTVLVDTGIGPWNVAGEPGTRLPDSLRDAGVAPDEIDAVLTTHMHHDHIGWNTTPTDDGPRVTFPRARYVVQRAEWEHWMQSRGAATPHLDERLEGLLAATVQPLETAGVIELVEGEHAVAPWVRFLPTPGHTPGHACILIDSGGERAVILGDVAHNPVQVEEPDWTIMADWDKPLARRSRRDLWDQVEEHGLTVCAGHFTGPTIGRFVRVEGKRTWRAL